MALRLISANGVSDILPEDMSQSNEPFLIHNDDRDNKFAANPYSLQAETLHQHVAMLTANGVDTLCWYR